MDNGLKALLYSLRSLAWHCYFRHQNCFVFLELFVLDWKVLLEILTVKLFSMTSNKGQSLCVTLLPHLLPWASTFHRRAFFSFCFLILSLHSRVVLAKQQPDTPARRLSFVIRHPNGRSANL